MIKIIIRRQDGSVIHSEQRETCHHDYPASKARVVSDVPGLYRVDVYGLNTIDTMMVEVSAMYIATRKLAEAADILRPDASVEAQELLTKIEGLL